MAKISIQVLQGADRGKVFKNLHTPITVGREEGNSVQLNDERISRFHIKIQEDNNRLVLTDLDSTNGTQVNGQDCQLKILRVGDIVAVGRSVLLVGSKEEIADHVESLTATGEGTNVNEVDDGDFEVAGESANVASHIRASRESFVIPEMLTPYQAAQLSEMIEVIGQNINFIITEDSKINEDGTAQLTAAQWQILLNLSSNLAAVVRQIADPHS